MSSSSQRARSPSWTTKADLRAQAERLWDRGLLLRAALAEDASVWSAVDQTGHRVADFPLRLTLRPPTSSELADRFEEVRAWIVDLRAAKPVRIVGRQVNHRTLGANEVPSQAWLDSLDEAAAFIGRRKDIGRFQTMAAEARRRRPETIAWLLKRPVVALEHAEVWSALLDVVEWMEANPDPGIYLRQVDLPSIDTKLIELHRSVLAEIIDISLPSLVVDHSAIGVRGFQRRFGFASKPNLVRFRVLDRSRWIVDRPTLADPPDVSLDATTFAALDLPVERIYITENETNFLVFPELDDAMVVWGGGFGTERLTAADWMNERTILYWGDIDTHGFAILDELRRRFARVESVLMDRKTLLAHQSWWVTEPSPETRDLPRLTADEATLYDELRTNRYGPSVRLEQERVSYAYLVANLPGRPHKKST